MLIGLSAKNAILIVEFAKMEYDKGATLLDAALTGAKLRLRPILMTAFAFILGCVPLWVATGAGGISRQVLGTVVIGGMLAATLLAIFFIPVSFDVVERFGIWISAAARKSHRPRAAAGPRKERPMTNLKNRRRPWRCSSLLRLQGGPNYQRPPLDVPGLPRRCLRSQPDTPTGESLPAPGSRDHRRDQPDRPRYLLRGALAGIRSAGAAAARIQNGSPSATCRGPPYFRTKRCKA